jgi:glycosyltransferase
VVTISLITPTLNNAETIIDTLESVKNQSYPNIEHIIIDGGSKDDTLSIIKQFPHVKILISEYDKGIYDAMNKGLSKATGDIIGILNADDFYVHNNVIQSIVDIFNKEKCDTLYADLVVVDKNDDAKIVRYWKSGKFNTRKMLYGWTPPHPTFFARRQVYQKYGYFRPEFQISGDYELMLRFLFKNKVSAFYLPETIIKMRAGGRSSMNLKNRILANKEDRLAWRVNDIKPKLFTTTLKPLRKLIQFV